MDTNTHTRTCRMKPLRLLLHRRLCLLKLSKQQQARQAGSTRRDAGGRMLLRPQRAWALAWDLVCEQDVAV
eukprot:scaffold55490_cov19-Tisochrysis_lutea.AAC.1